MARKNWDESRSAVLLGLKMRALNRMAVLPLLATISTVTLMVYIGPAAAQRACSPQEGGPLATGENGVYSDFGAFLDQSGHSVDFEILSLAEPKSSPDVRGLVDMCLRYEIKNYSSSDIESLRWTDIGLPEFKKKITPNEQPPGWVTPRQDVLPDAVLGITKINAYGGRPPVDMRAYFAQRRITVRGAQFIYPHQFSVQLAIALLEADLEPTIVESIPISFLGNFVERPLYYHFMLGPEESVEVSSTIRPSDEGVQFSFTIKSSSNLEVAVPLFRSMEELDPGPTIVSTIEIAGSIDSFVRSADAVDVSFALTIDHYESEISEFIAFIVEHPVTIRQGDDEACILQRAYSPIPLNVSERKCDLPENVINSWVQ